MNEEIDAGAELVRRFDEYGPVKAAFWLKGCDDANRFLYIASERIEHRNIDVAYREVVRLVLEIRSPYLNLFRVKVVGVDNPLAKAAAEINDQYSSRLAIRYGARAFGGISVDDVYLYPSPLPAASV